MPMWLAHARSFVLPLTAAGLVPLWLIGWKGIIGGIAGGPLVALIAGGVLAVAGLAMLVWTVSLFARVGRGTLAPWDPTRHLVLRGPYRHVRNPMISGVATILLGEAVATGAPRLYAWAASFVVINHIYFVLSEEPGLLQRFGAEYQEYRRAVPRWLPRLRAFEPPAGGPAAERL